MLRVQAQNLEHTMPSTIAPEAAQEPEDRKPKDEKPDPMERVTEGASRGGQERARRLTKEERSEIARMGAMAKWAKQGVDITNVPRATHSGALKIGDIEFECAVLDDTAKTRVISQTEFMRSMGMYRSGAIAGRREADESGALTPQFLAFKNLKPFVERHFGPEHVKLLPYRSKGGFPTQGIPAVDLPKMCEVWLDAEREGQLGKRQKDVARNADTLMRGFARVGIIALVDEATGFQYERPRRDLEEYLSKYLSESLRRWVRTFPADYFKHLCRLRGVPLRKDMKLPRYFAVLTNNLIYKRLAPGILRKLKQRKSERGHRRARGVAPPRRRHRAHEDPHEVRSLRGPARHHRRDLPRLPWPVRQPGRLGGAGLGTPGRLRASLKGRAQERARPFVHALNTAAPSLPRGLKARREGIRAAGGLPHDAGCLLVRVAVTGLGLGHPDSVAPCPTASLAGAVAT
jgi:hypothetical protein